MLVFSKLKTLNFRITTNMQLQLSNMEEFKTLFSVTVQLKINNLLINGARQ